MFHLSRPSLRALRSGAGAFNSDFGRLWSGQTVSVLGSQVTLLALPLTAVLVLKAHPSQMGLLAAAGSAPYLLVGLFAGVWVDRVRRRPILMAADLGRALLLASIPLAAWLHVLGMAQLYVVAFLAGILRVFFDVASQSFLPVLVGHEALVAANSKLETSNSVAGIVGPGLAGALVQLVTAPVAILVDALSFLVSALFLRLIRTREPLPARHDERQGLLTAIREGLRLVWTDPLLRPLVISGASFSLFDSLLMAVYVLYMVRTLALTPALVGVVFALGSVGGLAGALLAGPLTRRIGLGRALVGGILAAGVAELGIALAGGPPLVALLIVIVAEAGVQCGDLVYDINAVSLRQSRVADRVQGRVNATVRVCTWGMAPLGALAGGVLAERYGLRPAVVVAGAGTLCAFLWVLCSPVRSLREAPGPVAAPAVVDAGVAAD